MYKVTLLGHEYCIIAIYLESDEKDTLIAKWKKIMSSQKIDGDLVEIRHGKGTRLEILYIDLSAVVAINTQWVRQ